MVVVPGGTLTVVQWSPSLAHHGCKDELLHDVKVVEATSEDKLWHRLRVRHLGGGRTWVCVCVCVCVKLLSVLVIELIY